MFANKKVLFVLMIAALAAAAVLATRVPLARGQDDSGITVNLAPYEGNPILDKGPSGSWDEATVWGPIVVFHDGLYHMFYSGAPSDWSTVAIGYATSADGLVWEEYSGNPVLEADGTGFDAAAVLWGAVIVEGDTWVLYYLGERVRTLPEGIGRATAPDPTGPWTRNEDPVLTKGNTGEWDSAGIYPSSIIAADDGYVMSYSGGDIIGGQKTMIGMATSPDGLHWTKYDDPTTTDPPYAESDPILQAGFEGWRMNGVVGGIVRQTAGGWEMFYSETGRPEGERLPAYWIGYATSDDGLHWVKDDGFPILSGKDDPAASSVRNVLAGSVVVNDSDYFLYYDYHWSYGGIGLATGTVTRE